MRLDERLLDPTAPWAAARSERLNTLFPAYLVSVGLFAALWVLALVRVRTPWIAVALGAALVPLVTEPASYYYSFVLLAVPLARVLRSLEVALVGLAGAGQLIALRFHWLDDRFVGLSMLHVAFALALIAAFSRGFGRLSWLRAARPAPMMRRTS